MLLGNRKVLADIPRTDKGLLLIANHPSILDAPIILSMVPDVVCVFKAALKQHLIMGNTARMAGYISNESGLELIREMEMQLKAGGTVLIFPEGTRTSGAVMDSLNAGYALVAMRAKVPIQLIAIHSRTPILSKRLSILKSGPGPGGFDFALGPVIEPAEFPNVRQLNRFVEEWYAANLPRMSRLPAEVLPLHHQWIGLENGFSGELRVPDDPAYCRGHMPGWPLVPGYIQMAWARELACIAGYAPETGMQFVRWKFLHPLQPADVVEFNAEIKGEALVFTFTSRDRRVTTGRLLGLKICTE